MITSYKQLKQEIVDVLGVIVLKQVLKFVQFSNGAICGSLQPPKASSAITLVTLYKDIHGIGYDALRKHIHPFWDLSNEAIQRNIKYVRTELRRWANQIIEPEDTKDLTRLATQTNRPSPCENVILWVDSSDFRIKGKRSLHKKKKDYAKRLKSPGRRWLTICNVRGQTQWISSSHSPTCYDGDLMIRYAMDIEKLFPDTTIIGDNYFRKASSFFKRITLITPKSRAGRRKKVNGVLVPRELSSEDENINKVISLVRGKVESPDSWVKQKFSALAKPFYEDEDQHDCLVRFALACHRLMV
jgi:hypothetical protein